MVPLTYMTDGSREPETVRLFTSLRGPTESDRPIIMLSTIQQVDEMNAKMRAVHRSEQLAMLCLINQ